MRVLLILSPLLFSTLACQIHFGTPQTPASPVAGKLENNDANMLPQTSQGEATQAKVLVPEFREPLYTDLQQETQGSAGGDFDVDVSPDGTALAFSSTRYSKSPKIFMRDAGGAIVQKTSGPQKDIQPKFSPDGKWIAFASDRDGNFDILVVPADRNEAYLQVTRNEVDEIHPTWSPDGTRLAYSARDEDSGDWNLMIVSLEDRRVVQLGLGLNPEWSPDGSSLAFQRPSQRGPGWYGVWIVGVKGGSPREVFADPSRGAIQPSWSPDSQSLVFATASTPLEFPEDTSKAQADDLWIVDLDGMHLYRLTHHSASEFAPSWGLDDRIYFTSLRGKQPRLWSLVRTASPGLLKMGSSR